MKSRVKKRVIALMLCMVMVLSSGISTLAEGDAGTPEATEEVSSTNDESAVNTEPDTAVAEESQSRSNTAVETETAAEENAPAEAEAQPKTAEAAPAENTEEDAAAQTPVEETQTEETKDNAADAQSTEQSAENGEAVQEETTTPETENETAQNTETAPQPYEGKYEDDTIKITVNAEAGIVPEGAELSVTPIEKTEITDDMTAEEKAEAEKINDQYDLTEKKLNEDSEENEVTMEGFLAYDISFLVNGEEVEPSGDVNVVMEFQEAAIPEGVSEDADVTVKHLKEDETAEDGVVVEDMADKAEVQTTDKAEVEKVELTTDSFSTFTLTWQYGNAEWSDTNRIQITAYYVDEYGRELSDSLISIENALIAANQTYDLSSYVKPISGYAYQTTRVKNAITGTEITELKSEITEQEYWGRPSYVYSVSYHQKDKPDDSYTSWLSSNGTKNGNIYFIYSQAQLTIEDKIMEDGTLAASYSGDTEAVSEYVWYRSDTLDGEYTPVTRIRYENDRSNLSDNGDALYPAFDEGARKWYKVTALDSEGNEITTSGPVQVSYYDSLQNGGFEIPDVTDTTEAYSNYNSEYADDNNWQYSNAEYVSNGGVWQSTAEVKGADYYTAYIQGKKVAVEIVREGLGDSGAYSWVSSSAWQHAASNEENPTDAAEDVDKQFAELNCQAAGALYQDVLTIEGRPLNYYLEHRARGGVKNVPSTTPEYDTMYLVIMPTQIAVEEPLTTQEQLQTYLSEELEVNIRTSYDTVDSSVVYNQNGILVVRVTSNDQAWQYVSGVNYIPTTSLTRFFFVAGATATENNTVGNFLDDVGFGQDLPPVREDQFTLELTKTIEGLDGTGLETLRNDLEFKIAVKDKRGKDLTDEEIEERFGIQDGTIAGSDMIQDVDGNLSFVIANRQIGEDAPYTVTITENNAEVAGYTLTSTSTTRVDSAGAEGTEQSGSTAEISGQDIAYVNFTNTYDRSENKTVNFTKIWDDAENKFETRPDSITVTLHASVTVEQNGRPTVIDLTAEDLGLESLDQTVVGPDWETSWEVPVYYDNNGVQVAIDYTVTEGSIDSDYVYEAVNGGEAVKVEDGESAKDAYGEMTFDADSIDQSDSADTQNDATPARAQRSALLNTARAGKNTESDLGEPLHRKYIEYDSRTGEYTLNLDVTGAKGEAKGVDVLFVIDTSGSMADKWVGNWFWGHYEDGLLSEVQNLLTDENGIIDQIFEEQNSVNSVAFVSFAGRNQTESHGWYNAANINSLKEDINDLSADGGTNWTYAFQRASRLLARQADSGNEKVVIFLSDGKPTFTMDGNDEDGTGSDTEDSYYDDAANVVKGSSALSNAQIFSVYLNDETEDGMKTFSDKLSNSQLVNGTNLSGAMEDILEQVIPTYSNVVITDELSEYVEFAESDPVITVTKTSANGTETVLDGSQYYPDVNPETGDIKVYLLTTDPSTKGGELEDRATYTVSFKVTPSEKANKYYAEHNQYPHTGDEDTGITSAGQKGFFSNTEDGAYVDYEVNGNEKDPAEYARPVVQVNTHTLTYTKAWITPDGVENPTDDVQIRVTYTDGTAKEITLTNNQDYIYSEVVPITKEIMSVEELNVHEDYTASYQISSDRTKATVTNSYSRITSTSIQVIKEWAGNGEKTPVQVALYRSIGDGQAELYDEIKTLNEENSWSCSWNDLPERVDGQACSYAVREVNIPPHYESSMEFAETDEKTTVTITNTYDENCADENFYIANVLQTDRLTVHKIWDDNSDELNYRPDDLGVQVSDGKNTYDVTLSGNGDEWQAEVTVLRAKGDYSAQESLGNDSDYEQTGYYINNNHIYFTNALKETAITVHKAWNDGINDSQANDRPTTITFELQYRIKDSGNEWQSYGNYNLSVGNTVNDENWTRVIDNLPAVYEYKIVEQNVSDGYVSSVSGPDQNGRYTITNTLKWSAIKTDTPLVEGEDPIGLSGAVFELKQGDTVIANGESGADGAITWTPTKGNNIYSLNGTYTIEETKAPAGYVINSSGWKVQFENGLLAAFNDTPVSGTADAGIVIQLQNDKIYELPESGGSGIYWYMLGGVLLMMAGSLLVYKKRRGEVLRRK